MKVGVLVVAYNAESTLVDVLDRISPSLRDELAEVLVQDDHSADDTFRVATEYLQHGTDLPLTVIRHPQNLGYGGNQKAGYTYAINHGWDVVVMLHGDGQYAPEALDELVRPIVDGTADAVFGSRMMTPGGALAGGHAALQVRRQPGAHRLPERDDGPAAVRVALRLPGLPRVGARRAAVRRQQRRLRLRHRDHPPAARRRDADRRGADPHLLRGRDLPRERPGVREGRGARHRAPPLRPQRVRRRAARAHRRAAGVAAVAAQRPEPDPAADAAPPAPARAGRALRRGPSRRRLDGVGAHRHRRRRGGARRGRRADGPVRARRRGGGRARRAPRRLRRDRRRRPRRAGPRPTTAPRRADRAPRARRHADRHGAEPRALVRAGTRRARACSTTTSAASSTARTSGSSPAARSAARSSAPGSKRPGTATPVCRSTRSGSASAAGCGRPSGAPTASSCAPGRRCSPTSSCTSCAPGEPTPCDSTAAPAPDVARPRRRRRERSARWSRRATLAATALFVLVVTRWRPWLLFARGGYTTDFYEAQARSMWHLRLDVPASVAGIEGFLIDGRTYLYFGPFLAVARMPFTLIGHAFDGRLTRLSMVLGFVVACSAAHALAVEARRHVDAHRPDRSHRRRPRPHRQLSSPHVRLHRCWCSPVGRACTTRPRCGAPRCARGRSCTHSGSRASRRDGTRCSPVRSRR